MITLKLLVMFFIAVLGVAANPDRKVRPPNRVPRPMPKPEIIRPLEIPSTSEPTPTEPSPLHTEYPNSATPIRPGPRPIRPKPLPVGLPTPTPINAPPTVPTFTKNPDAPTPSNTLIPSGSTGPPFKPQPDIIIQPNKDPEESEITNPTETTGLPTPLTPPPVPLPELPPVTESSTETKAPSLPPSEPPTSAPSTAPTPSSPTPELTASPILQSQPTSATKGLEYSKNDESITQRPSYPNKQTFERYPTYDDKNGYPYPKPQSVSPPPPPPSFTPVYNPKPTPSFAKPPYNPAPTRPSKTTETIKYDSCKPGVNSFFPINEDCGAYIECRRGVATKLTCPDGLLYNTLIPWPEYPCSYSSEVKCDGRSIFNRPQPSGECPRQYGYFARGDGICDSYLLCQEGKALIMKCPAGLAYNADKSSCDWPANVPSCNLNVFKGFKCPPTPVDEFGNPSDNIYNFRYNKSCKEYVACHREFPRLLRCDQGLAFDESLNSCTDADFVEGCNALPIL